MNSKVIIPILIYILFIITAITFIIGIFYFDWFTNGKKNNSYNKIAENIETFKETIDEQKENTELDTKTFTDSSKQEILKDNETALSQTNVAKIEKSGMPDHYTANKSDDTKIYGKGSSLPDVSFDAQGEYVSNEEYQYRLSLIRNLTIKSVVIDKLTKGNGVSQEFFKVVYKEKMIPAKILDEIVESKEFRELIPVKYRDLENKTTELKKGEKVAFNNKSIRELLILWSLGRLTPVQKAWKVKAEK